MMKSYIKPEINISLFDEEILTSDPAATLVPTSAAYGDKVTDFLNKSAGNKVQRNYDFNNAIKFN